MDFFASFDDELFIQKQKIIKNEKNEIVLKKIEERERTNLVLNLIKNKDNNINNIQKIVKDNNFIFSWRNPNNESILFLALKFENSKYLDSLIISLIMNDHNNELECISKINGRTCLMLAFEKNIELANRIYFKYDFDIYHHDKNNKSLFSYVFTKKFLSSEKMINYVVIQNLINRYLEKKDNEVDKFIYEFKNKEYHHILNNIVEQDIDELKKHIDFQNFFDFIQFDFTNLEDSKLFMNSLLEGDNNILIQKGYSDLIQQNGKIDLKDIDEDNNYNSWIAYLFENSRNMDEEDYLKILQTKCLINSNEDYETMSVYEEVVDDDDDENNYSVQMLKFVKNIIIDIKEMSDNEFYDLLRFYVHDIVLNHPKVNKILENENFTNIFFGTYETIEIFIDILEKEKDNNNIKTNMTFFLFHSMIDFIFELNLNKEYNNNLDIDINRIRDKFNENLIHKVLDKFESQYNIKNESKKLFNLSCQSTHSCNLRTHYFYYLENNDEIDNKPIKICKEHLTFKSLLHIFYVFKILNYESVFRRFLQYKFNFENYFELLDMLKDNNRFLSIIVNVKKVKDHINLFIKKSNKIDSLKNEKCELECIVCFEKMENSYIECSTCKQKTHSKCGLEWLKRNTNCMYCRTSIQHLKNQIQNIEKIVFYEELKKLIV
jgi:hypothetical protein